MRHGPVALMCILCAPVSVRVLTALCGQAVSEGDVHGKPFTLDHRARGISLEDQTFVVDREGRIGPLGTVAHRLFVRRDVEAIFDFRHQALARSTARDTASRS